MILHTHRTEDPDNPGEFISVLVIHASFHETKTLSNSLHLALENNPESEQFAITLGRADDIIREESEPVAEAGIITPGSGLIIP